MRVGEQTLIRATRYINELAQTKTELTNEVLREIARRHKTSAAYFFTFKKLGYAQKTGTSKYSFPRLIEPHMVRNAIKKQYSYYAPKFNGTHEKQTRRPYMMGEDRAIKTLKKLGYKIMKPVSEFKEV